jgi:hypothetical protein
MNRLGMPLLVLFLISQALALAQDTPQKPPISITTTDGTTYQNVKVTRKDAHGLTIMHQGGICTLRIADLTDDSRTTLGVSVSQQPVINIVTSTLPAQSSRQAPCRTCSGFRSIMCQACRGGGFGPDVIEQQPCKKCGGDGTVQKKKVLFEHGGGPGQMKDVHYTTVLDGCPSCAGRGYTEVKKAGYCGTCGGHKTIACPSCARR